MGTTLLQIFLLVNVFIIGALVVVGAQHVYAHFHPEKRTVSKRPTDFQLSQAMREQLIKEAQAHFEIVTNRGASDLARKLDGASDGMVGELHKLGEQAVLRQSQTFESARGQLTGAAETAQTQLAGAAEAALQSIKQSTDGASAALTQRTDEFMKQLESELADVARERKEKLAGEIDTKLNDAVVSLLLETLGHEVDLGAQMPYIVARLNENKDALKAEVRS